jgi:hypothetical protein
VIRSGEEGEDDEDDDVDVEVTIEAQVSLIHFFTSHGYGLESFQSVLGSNDRERIQVDINQC